METNGSKQEAVGGHAFALHSYDEATDTFLISNPWTESNSWSYYNTTFSLPLEFLWDAHFKPTVAITNPAPEFKNFNYAGNATFLNSTILSRLKTLMPIHELQPINFIPDKALWEDLSY